MRTLYCWNKHQIWSWIPGQVKWLGNGHFKSAVFDYRLKILNVFFRQLDRLLVTSWWILDVCFGIICVYFSRNISMMLNLPTVFGSHYQSAIYFVCYFLLLWNLMTLNLLWSTRISRLKKKKSRTILKGWTKKNYF